MSIIKYGNGAYSSVRFSNRKKVIFFTEPSLTDWTYTTATNGQITLTGYTGSYDKTIQVPNNGDKYRMNRTCFSNNNSLVSIDLGYSPVVGNSMFSSFSNCYNLTSVSHINSSVTKMSFTFHSCTNLNQNIQIPNSVTNMSSTFFNCTNLNQNIQIPNSVTNMSRTFMSCVSLNQNIQIPSSVASMSFAFASCSNLNQNIQIPNSVTNMSRTFLSCASLNQNIQIPSSVADIDYTFFGCTNLQGRINILSENIINASDCFSGTLPKDVYIPYNYTGTTERTQTFNSFVSAGYLYANGVSKNQYGVTVHDLNT